MDDLVSMTPAEIDTLLFPLLAERWALAHRAREYRLDIAASLFPGSIGTYSSRWGYRKRSGPPTIQLKQWAQMADEAEAKLEEVKAQIVVFDDEFDRRGGWIRYVLVGGGHLHYDHCHTLRYDTQRYLLAESSGLTPKEVVERYSYTACTKCFPDAPVAQKLTPAEEGFCPGSGKGVLDKNGSLRLYRKWGLCSECGQGVSATSRLLARKHKVK
jgi:hypothetical protein